MIGGSAANGSPRLKVCCIASVTEAQLAIRHGAHAIGLVSSMPSGPGVVPDDRIEEIANSVRHDVSTFLLTSARRVDDIVEQQRRFRVDTIQICDALPLKDLRRLRSILSDVSIVQVIHVVGESAIDEARRVAREAHALLLDSGDPSNSMRELGGTGRTHDWSLSRAIREKVEIPVWLAGGLTPENVAEAVHRVHPFGVDVCSGLRIDGLLDEDRLVRFVENLQTVPSPGAP